MKRKLKCIPKFRNEDEEREFWSKHDSTDYLDWKRAKKVTLPNLKPSVKTISIRLPEMMLEELKLLANKRDVPYQSLLKIFLAERIAAELEMADKSRTGTIEPVRFASRSMPESLAAEAAVLGSMIIDPECISEVVEQLTTDAFYRVEHRYIFDALIALYEKHKGEAIDAVLLRDELEKRKQLEEVGGVEYLAKVADSVPSSANVNYYAGIIKEKMMLREAITVASEILDDSYNEAGEPGEILDEAERRIFAIKLRHSKSAAKKNL